MNSSADLQLGGVSLADLNQMVAQLSSAETAGIGDVVVLRSRLYDEIARRRRSIRLDAVTARREIRGARKEERRCPSCGRFVLIKPKGVGEPVLVCPKCHYSEYRGVR